jgi:hypothetical protein
LTVIFAMIQLEWEQTERILSLKRRSEALCDGAEGELESAGWHHKGQHKPFADLLGIALCQS